MWAVLKNFAITVPCPRSSQDAAPVEATEILGNPAKTSTGAAAGTDHMWAVHIS